MSDMQYLPKPPADENLLISNEGLENIIKNLDKQCPERNFLWCTDYKTELPVRVKKTGPGSEKPYTIGEMWQRNLKELSNNIALNYEKT